MTQEERLWHPADGHPAVTQRANYLHNELILGNHNICHDAPIAPCTCQICNSALTLLEHRLRAPCVAGALQNRRSGGRSGKTQVLLSLSTIPEVVDLVSLAVPASDLYACQLLQLTGGVQGLTESSLFEQHLVLYQGTAYVACQQSRGV